MSLPIFSIFGIESKNRKMLDELKDKYKGKRCFIVCNGPSLTPEDLTNIYDNGDISFGMNNIARIYDKTPWRPTFLSITDDIAYTKKNKLICQKCDAEYKFYDKKRYLCSLNHTAKNKFYLGFNESHDLLDNPVFDPDPFKLMPSIGTSTYVVLELAVFMGFKEIYIIGCDMSYSVNIDRKGRIYYNTVGKEHFYATEDDDVKFSNEKPNPTWQMEVAFDTAEKYSREHGIRIFNATRGGMCESFERVEFDGLF